MSLVSIYIKQMLMLNSLKYSGNTIVLNNFNSELSKYRYIIRWNVTKYVYFYIEN